MKLKLRYKRYGAYRKMKKTAEQAAQIRADLVGWDCDGYYCCDCPYKATPDTCEVLNNLLKCINDYDSYYTEFVMLNYECTEAGLKDKKDLMQKIDGYSVNYIEGKYQKYERL